MNNKQNIDNLVTHLDGFLSSITGLGNANKDPTKGHSYWLTADDYKTQTEIEGFYYKEGLAARVVEVLPEEMLKKGIEVQVPSSKEIQTSTVKELKRLKLLKKLKQAMIYGRLYGGGAILMGLQDGMSPNRPVNPDKVKKVLWLNVLHRFQLTAVDRDEDPMSETFGEILTYSVSGAGVATPIIVHSSRLIKFTGVDLPLEVERNISQHGHEGWGESVLIRVWDPIRRFVESTAAVEVMVKDFHQTTIKLKELVSLIGTGEEDQDALVTSRLRLMVLTKSIFNAYVIDEQDSVSSSSPMVTGLEKLFEIFMLHLASVSRTPLTKLFGRSPAGMNATGESDELQWIELVVASQEADLRDPLENLLTILFSSTQGPSNGQLVDFNLVFPPPRELSALDQATVRKTQAETDGIYIDRLVVSSEEVAQSRFGGPEYSTVTSLDVEKREAEGAPQPSQVQTPPQSGIEESNAPA